MQTGSRRDPQAEPAIECKVKVDNNLSNEGLENGINTENTAAFLCIMINSYTAKTFFSHLTNEKNKKCV